MKKIVEKKGITLIALVITIILLLLLSGITINLVLEHSGLFDEAQNAENIQNQETAREKLSLSILDLQLRKQTNTKLDHLIELTDNDIKVETINEQVKIYNEKNKNYAICSVNGYKFKVYDDFKIVLLEDNILTPEEKTDVLIEYSSTTNNLKNSNYPKKLLDQTTNHYDAILNNSYYNNNKGIIFNGSSTYGSLDGKSLNLTFPLTITATVNWKTTSNNLLFSDELSKIGIGTYQNKFLLNNGTNNSSSWGYYYNIPSNFSTNAVNYITVVYKTNAKDSELYINGQQLSPTSSMSSWALNETGTYLGRRNSGSYFNGILYDFKIYNKQFSPADINTLYTMEKYNFENNVISNNNYSENVILHYDCNQGRNEEDEYPFMIQGNYSQINDIRLYNVKYNNLKNGLIFNGSSSYGIITDTNFKLDFPLTLSFVITSNSFSNNLLFTNKLSKIGIGFWESTYMILENDTTSAAFYNISNDFLKNDINYITVVYENNSNTNKLYINGKEITSEKIYNGWRADESGTYLGRRNSGSYFNGTLYKFKIYNKILTKEEIVKEYESDKNYYSSNVTN